MVLAIMILIAFGENLKLNDTFEVKLDKERIINYREIPAEKRIEVVAALESIGFVPAFGGVKTMLRIMDKSVPETGPQFYFVFRKNELIGYQFLIGDEKKYKAFPWLVISNMDEQKMVLCEKMMELQIAFFESLGMYKMVEHSAEILEDYRNGIGKRKESECR